MAVPSSIADLDPVASNNSPSGSEAVGTALDDYLRAHAAIIKQNGSFTQSGVGAVTRVLQDKMRESVSVLDFGAVGDGVTDDTAAIQEAINSGAAKVYFPGVSAFYKVTANLTPLSNQTLYGDGAKSKVQTATTNISVIFVGSGSINVVITDLNIRQTAWGVSAYVALVNVFESTYVTVKDCVFNGMQWSGVLLNKSNYCTVQNNSFLGFGGSVFDSSDVCIYNSSSHNVVSFNMMLGGGYHGVFIQDPTYGTYLPSWNTVAYNEIVGTSCTGITNYIGNGSASDSYNKIVGNRVTGVTGVNGVSNGHGIYVVGLRVGGCSVTDNVVTNCCISTSNMANQPGGISIEPSGAASAAPVICSNNIVMGMTRGHGIIVVTGTAAPVSCSNNVVEMPSTNNAATYGGPAFFILNSSNVSVSGGYYSHAGDRDTFFIQNSSGSALTGISISSLGTKSIGTGQGFRTYSPASDISMTASGVNSTSTNAVTQAFQLSGLYLSSVTGCVGNTVSQSAMSVTACTKTRIANCSLTTTGTTFLTMTGTCTGSMVGDSNYLGTIPTNIANSSTGGNVQFRYSSIPVSGTWTVGDRVSQSVPTVGSPKGWVCTVAGVPGTWVSEGNL
jgi:hypothetical protein